jgi:hypothetical protein
MLPIRFGTDQEFTALRGMLQDAGYNDAALCARAEVSSIYTVLMSEKRLKHEPPLTDTLDALMWVLLEGRPLTVESWQNLIPAGLATLLAAFGLVVGQDGDVICPIALYPVEDLFVISDRNSQAVDHVYPALIKETGQFLEIIPRNPCDAFLELCAGTAIAAMIPARDFAKHSYAFDIADRCVQFAEFNRRLNGLDNMTNSAGDLYEPAGSKMFDRIVAHPPYVPVLKPKAIFHDGGDDGEQIVRRIVEGLPAYLAPGGQFAMLAMGSDRDEAPYEYRARKWLGDAHEEFDIALVSRNLMLPAEFVAQSIMRGKTDSSEIDRWHDVFASRGVNTLVYGTLLISRKTEGGAPFTVRRQKGDRSARAEMDWLMDWEGAVASGVASGQVLSTPLTAAPDMELRVLNRMKDGAWTPSNYLLQSSYPFNMECQTHPWMAYLLGKAHGGKTGREMWKQLIDEEVLRPDISLDQFATALTMLVSGGFLHF